MEGAWLQTRYIVILAGLLLLASQDTWGLSRDLQVLLQLKKELQDPRGSLVSWNATAPCSSWQGVTCDLDRVVRLLLPRKGFSGIVPPIIAELHNLELLDLHSNTLTGPVPIGIVNLTKLIHLDLSSNHLRGEIPGDIGNLSELEVLLLHNNSFTGAIPASLGRCHNLATLWLSGNDFGSSIPPELGNCSRLEWLGASENALSGHIPDQLGKLENLQGLDLRSNAFQGRIPAELGSCQRLTLLSLSYNQLSGGLPAELSKLSRLENLIVSGNQLNGTITPQLGSCQSLTELHLNDNQLIGGLPAELSRLSKLEYLDISTNHLSGTIPPQLGRLSSLRQFQAKKNSLTGEIPGDLRNCGVLQWLDLSWNNFTSISPEFVSLSLFHIDLSNNQLSGQIPREFGGSLSVSYMDFSGNKLNGTIPPALGSLTWLIVLDLSNNQLTGRIPDELASLPLDEVNLAHNRLTGPLPKGWLQKFNSGPFADNLDLCLSNSCQGEGASSGSLRKISPKAIAGILSGALVVAILAIALGWWAWRRHLTRDKGLDFGDKKSALTLATIVSATDNFHSDYIIGKGGFGTVYKATLPSGLIVAVKRLKQIQDQSLTNDRSSIRELKTAGAIRHRNIVKLRAFFKAEGGDLLVYDFMPNGSIGDLLYKSSMEASWELRYEIALGTAHGLSYLHYDCKPPIIHRDIKPNNILLDSNMVARIADFGLAKLIDNHATTVSLGQSLSYFAGSFGYIAPEYAFTMRVNEKTDVYSYGVVLLELLARKPPTDGLVSSVRSKVGRKDLSGEVAIDNSLWVTASEQEKREILLVLKIALFCTNDRPADRPTMRQVVEMLRQAKNVKA